MWKAICASVLLGWVSVVSAGSPDAIEMPADDAASRATNGGTAPDEPGIALPFGDGLRVRVDMLFGYGNDYAIASTGHETQGRVGWASVGISGKLSHGFYYLLDFNPVNDNQPLPTCGEADYFYPNTPPPAGPQVSCDPDGRTRVDDYRMISYNPLIQQGPLREAYAGFVFRFADVRFGRFIVPIGFRWDEVGSFSAKDATHIQRIDAEANFGAMVSLRRTRADGTPFGTVNMALVLGDGNRFHDYNYFYFMAGAEATKASPTPIFSGTIRPIRSLEVRGAFKTGYSGSKLERLPSIFASKRHDRALVASVRYRPLPFASVFAELARYRWGPTNSSFDLLQMPHRQVRKSGYYYGAEVRVPLADDLAVGFSATRERLGRDDTLVLLTSSQDLYRTTMGRQERNAAFRGYVDVGSIRFGGFVNLVSNPFPWLSGITPVSGPRGFSRGQGSNKYGVILRVRI